MLLLTTASTVLRLTTGSAGEVAVSYSYADNNAGVFSYGGDALTPITGAATTPIVPAPSTGQRNVRQVTVSNTHASVSNLCTVDVYDGTDAIPQWKGTLAPGERVILDEAGDWLYYAADGTLRAGPVAFTALSDVPSSYVGHALQIAHVNAGEDALEFTDGVVVNDSAISRQIGVDSSAVSTPVRSAGYIATTSVSPEGDDPSCYVELRCGVDESAPQVLQQAVLTMFVSDPDSQAATFSIAFLDDGLGAVNANASWRIQRLGLAQIVFDGLPTADPHVVDALWNNGGVLTLSAG